MRGILFCNATLENELSCHICANDETVKISASLRNNDNRSQNNLRFYSELAKYHLEKYGTS